MALRKIDFSPELAALIDDVSLRAVMNRNSTSGTVQERDTTFHQELHRPFAHNIAAAQMNQDLAHPYLEGKLVCIPLTTTTGPGQYAMKIPCAQKSPQSTVGLATFERLAS